MKILHLGGLNYRKNIDGISPNTLYNSRQVNHLIFLDIANIAKIIK